MLLLGSFWPSFFEGPELRADSEVSAELIAVTHAHDVDCDEDTCTKHICHLGHCGFLMNVYARSTDHLRPKSSTITLLRLTFWSLEPEFALLRPPARMAI